MSTLDSPPFDNLHTYQIELNEKPTIKKTVFKPVFNHFLCIRLAFKSADALPNPNLKYYADRNIMKYAVNLDITKPG